MIIYLARHTYRPSARNHCEIIGIRPAHIRTQSLTWLIQPLQGQDFQKPNSFV